jgi:hypothetical protein
MLCDLWVSNTAVSRFIGLSAEFRYALIHRSAEFPIQVTLTAQPEWDAVGDAGQ